MLKSMGKKIVTALCAVCLISALQVFPVSAAEAFDPVFYAATYPDLAAALGTDPQVLLNHYLNYGMKEGRLPYRGAKSGAVVDGIAASSTAAPEVVPATGRYIDRVSVMLESLYQTYEMTRTKQRASLVLPAGVTAIVDEYDLKQDDGDGGIYTWTWKEYIYGNDMYRLSIDHSSKRIFAENGSWATTYAELADEYGVSVPYLFYVFTQQDSQYVASLLDSPVVLRRELEWPRDLTLPGNIRYDAFARVDIYGYYKGMPINIRLEDSFTAYPANRAPYQYMPHVNIGLLQRGIDEWINQRLSEGYRRQ